VLGIGARQDLFSPISNADEQDSSQKYKGEDRELKLRVRIEG